MKDYKKHFPFFKANPTHVYLDSACMGLKPEPVIKAITDYYEKYSSCAGRGNYSLSKELSEIIEHSRDCIAQLIGAKSKREIVFTRNTTESINLIANTFPFEKNARVIITEKEHNSNHCIWRELESKGIIRLTIIDVNEDNTFSLDILEDELKKGDVQLVSTIHVSNMDGIVNPAKDIARLAHAYGSKMLFDGAQAVPHIKTDVQDIDADFYAFSVHKMYGPSGMGILYIKSDHFNLLGNYTVGGDTIKNTFIDRAPEYKSVPYRFEGGLQNFGGISGTGAAACFIRDIGYEAIEERTSYLNSKFREFLRQYEEIFIIGDTAEPGCTTAFFLRRFSRTTDRDLNIGERIDRDYSIIMRTGLFCVNPYFDNRERKGMFRKVWYPAIRASFGFYNDEDDLERLIKAMKNIIEEYSKWPLM